MSSRCAQFDPPTFCAAFRMHNNRGVARLLTGVLSLQAFQYEGRFLINPGSVTGAYSNVTEDVKPSFVLMDIDGPKVRDRPGAYAVFLLPDLQCGALFALCCLPKTVFTCMAHPIVQPRGLS